MIAVSMLIAQHDLFADSTELSRLSENITKYRIFESSTSSEILSSWRLVHQSSQISLFRMYSQFSCFSQFALTSDSNQNVWRSILFVAWDLLLCQRHSYIDTFGIFAWWSLSFRCSSISSCQFKLAHEHILQRESIITCSRRIYSSLLEV